ncbi:MAG: RHS repeat-associated core domain-containing protein, partial [Acidobacteriota bacterium]
RLVAAEDSADPEQGLGVDGPVTYDANSNIEAITRGGSTETYRYADYSGRVERITGGAGDGDGETVDAYTYDANGSVTSAARLDLEGLRYGPGSGLAREIQVGDGTPEGIPGVSVRFEYDGLGERTLKQVRSPGGAKGADRLYLRGGGARALVEHVRTRTGQTERAKSVQYIYGAEGLIALHHGDERYHVIRDYIGSVRRVVDQRGDVVASYAYSPFGVTIVREGSSKPDVVLYRYTGQELDPETGLHNFHARLYDPKLGRFYGIDPARKGSSPYVYADNNVVNLVDPDGEEPVSAILLIVAISAGVGAAAGGLTYALTHKGNMDAGGFFAYAAIGAAAGALGGVAGFAGGTLATGVLASVGFSTSYSVATGVIVGAATAAADGAVSSVVNQYFVNRYEGRPANEGLGQAARLGALIGAGIGAGVGAFTGAVNRATAKRLADPDSVAHGVFRGGTHYADNLPQGVKKSPISGAGRLNRQLARAAGQTGDGEVLALVGHGARNSPGIQFNDSMLDPHGVFLRSVDEIGDQLQGNLGQNVAGINLVSCWAGRNGTARSLANRLKVPVRAANRPIYVFAEGSQVGKLTLSWGTLMGGSYRSYYPSKLRTSWNH